MKVIKFCDRNIEVDFFVSWHWFSVRFISWVGFPYNGQEAEGFFPLIICQTFFFFVLSDIFKQVCIWRQRDLIHKSNTCFKKTKPSLRNHWFKKIHWNAIFLVPVWLRHYGQFSSIEPEFKFCLWLPNADKLP